jgi:predicted PurR-regulated permease PerM
MTDRPETQPDSEPDPAAAGFARPAGRLRSVTRRLRDRSAAWAAASAAAAAQHAPVGRLTAAELAARGIADTQPPADPPAAIDEQVPRVLRQAAAWSWRIILVAALIYGTFRLAVDLRLVVLPLIAAMLLTALLQPVAARLHRAGAGPLLATWCTFLGAIIVIAGAISLAANQTTADYPMIVSEVRRTADELQKSLAGAPFHLHGARLQQLTNQVVQYISQHKAVIAGTVVTGGRIVLEIVAGLVLMLFVSFFLLKDGARIWLWLIGGLSAEAHRRMDRAGHAAWHTLTSYMRGTTAVAAIHAIFIGLALWLLGVPLLVPLIILVFLAAFIPLVGILVVGALATAVTLATKGWLAAVILVAVFLVENQIESHLLQPLVVGRAVRLHPLAIILVLAVGGVIAGIPGAIVAVPAAAVITYAWPLLREPAPVAPAAPVMPPEA